MMEESVHETPKPSGNLNPALYLIATPIGNLGDITVRAVETLKSVQTIACEDTRRTDKLLGHLGFRKSLLRYDEHTHKTSAGRLVELIRNGQSVALVTDAGTPAISDPGSRLVAEVVEAGLKVVPIPGPSAVTAAISAAGLVGDGFVFLGFLPRREGRARRVLQETLGLGRNLVLFESPFRVRKTLSLIGQVVTHGEVVVARELTKIHEEFLRGTVEQVQSQWKDRPEKGEVVIIVHPHASFRDQGRTVESTRR